MKQKDKKILSAVIGGIAGVSLTLFMLPSDITSGFNPALAGKDGLLKVWFGARISRWIKWFLIRDKKL